MWVSIEEMIVVATVQMHDGGTGVVVRTKFSNGTVDLHITDLQRGVIWPLSIPHDQELDRVIIPLTGTTGKINAQYVQQLVENHIIKVVMEFSQTDRHYCMCVLLVDTI